MSYLKIREKIKKVQKKLKCNIMGFGDLGPKEVAKITGLKLSLAELAKQREYNETFMIESKDQEKKIIRELKKEGLQVQFGGRFYSASSLRRDKGKAVKILSSLFKKKNDKPLTTFQKNRLGKRFTQKVMRGKIKTIGLGDSQNDLSLLKKVDLPILVQKPPGIWDPNIKGVSGLIKIKKIGPQGWVEAIKKYVL